MKTAYISFGAGLTDKTTQNLISSISEQVNRRIEHLYLMLSIFGGSDTNAFHLYHFLRALPVKLTTHACGLMTILGPTVALAGQTRLAVPNVVYGFQSSMAGSFGWNDQRVLAENLEITELSNRKNAAIIAERTKLTKTEAYDLTTGGRKSFGTDWAINKGFISEVKPLQIPVGVTIIQPSL